MKTEGLEERGDTYSGCGFVIMRSFLTVHRFEYSRIFFIFYIFFLLLLSYQRRISDKSKHCSVYGFVCWLVGTYLHKYIYIVVSVKWIWAWVELNKRDIERIRALKLTCVYVFIPESFGISNFWISRGSLRTSHEHDKWVLYIYSILFLFSVV